MMSNQLRNSVDATSPNDVKTTSCQNPGAMMSHRRWYDVDLTSYVPAGYLPAAALEISSRTYIEGKFRMRERSGSVVECLTRDRRAAGSSLTGVTALLSLSKTHLS